MYVTTTTTKTATATECHRSQLNADKAAKRTLYTHTYTRARAPLCLHLLERERVTRRKPLSSLSLLLLSLLRVWWG